MGIRLFLVCFIILVSSYIYGQEEKCPPLSDQRLQQLFSEAVDNYRRFQISRTISILSEVTRRDPGFAPAHYLLGLAYIHERNYRPMMAVAHFEEALKICPEIDPYLFFHLGRIYFIEGKFDLSAEMFEEFTLHADKVKKTDYEEALEKLEQAKFLHEGYSNPVPFNPQIVKGISSTNDEYLLTISADDKVALYTRRIQVRDQFLAWDTHVNYKEIFMQSFRYDNELFDDGMPLPPPFNRQFHEGSPSLTYDNRMLYFTACEFEQNYYNCNIHVSEFYNEQWLPGEKLCSNINSIDSWESQPSISPDGKTLFFVSDRNGRYDIFTSEKDDNGQWQPAKPLGPPINSGGNERSPFIHIDGRTLYFSSDGHPGFGGYDLFLSRLDDDGNWSKPLNLGYPINTSADETGMIVSTDGSTAYFASTRFHESGNWNIYSFELYEKARPEKVLFITGELKSDDENNLNEVNLQLRNLATLETRDVNVDSITGRYTIAELFRSDFLLTLKKENYAYTSRLLTTQDKVLQSPAEVDLELTPVEVGQTYKIQDIYFDYDKFILRDESKIVLYTLVEFLIDHPDVKLEIRGHTDNIGGEQYNQTLSDNRAKAVYDFLIENRINPNRLKYKGYGQNMPVDTNETEQGRANNRRTEFVILDK